MNFNAYNTYIYIYIYKIFKYHMHVSRYDNKLNEACAIGIKKGFVQGFSSAVVVLSIYGSYSVCFWYGSKLIRDGEFSPGDMITVFFI